MKILVTGGQFHDLAVGDRGYVQELTRMGGCPRVGT